MHIFWENSNWPGAHIEPAINCLTWMDSLDDTKPDQGLLAAGSESGSVGITHTYFLPEEKDDMKRYNFNLRGHHSPISMVAWNRNHSKLASCDTNGIIYVWVPNEERYSVEIINQRGVRVQELCWAPDGNAITIIYDDLVLVGGANGQRIWSNSFQESVRAGAWSYNSRELILGIGEKIQVFNSQGAVVFPERTISQGSKIKKIASSSLRECDKKWTIAICDESNKVYFINSYDDLFPKKWKCEETVIDMKWNSSGTYIGVICTNNKFFILDHMGRVLYSRKIIIPQPTPVLNLSKNDIEKDKSCNDLKTFTWAHEDNVLILAAGGSLAVGHVWRTIPKLSTLVTYDIWKSLGKTSKNINQLLLPSSIKATICALDHHIIKCRIPTPDELCLAICEPKNYMNYCSIIFDSKKRHFYLAIEHLGGNFPILKGKQINRLIPKFVISIPPHLAKHFQLNYFSPKSTNDTISSNEKQVTNFKDIINGNNDNNKNRINNGSSPQVEDLAAFRGDSNQRNSVWRKSKRQLRALVTKHFNSGFKSECNNVKNSQYAQNFKGLESLTKKKAKHIILNISANIICTKFQISASQNSYVSNYLPPFLGNVNFKTSVLHLQPRQMTVQLTDLTTLNFDSDNNNLNNSESITYTGKENNSLTESLSNEIDITSGLMPDEINSYADVCEIFGSLKRGVSEFGEILAEELNDLKQNQIYSPKRSSSAEPYVIGKEIHLKEKFGQNHIIQADSWHTVVDSLEFIDEEVNDSVPLIGEKSQSAYTVLSSINQSEIDNIENTMIKAYNLYNYLNEGTEHILGSSNILTMNEIISNPIIDHRKDILNIYRKIDYIEEMLLSIKNKTQNDTTELFERLSSLKEVLNHFPIQASDLEPSFLEIPNSNILSKNILIKKNKFRLPKWKTIFKQRSCPDMGSRPVDVQPLIEEPHNHRTASNRIVPTTSVIESTPQLLRMTNKAPFWNEQSQVYQLDFGGRVTQESAKNFQIEYKDKQVMQFGRIEGGAYTLDFCSPFSAVQAFAIALASITQRLK
uniref:WD_REPEATS_REGION domain-containing protein n=1 Tax=Parastrongyloides trichosuri TaxID=131310 RepID=A0A0N4ZFK8_PARTI